MNDNNIASLHGLENLKSLQNINLNNNGLVDSVSILQDDGTRKDVKNLDILAGLNTANGGSLTKINITGNSSLTNFTPLTSLTWSGGLNY